jgi:hypothetical protein
MKTRGSEKKEVTNISTKATTNGTPIARSLHLSEG